jgi:hypothetical protein
MDENHHQFIQVSYQILKIKNYQSDYQLNALTQTEVGRLLSSGRLLITRLITGEKLRNRPTSVITSRLFIGNRVETQ